MVSVRHLVRRSLTTLKSNYVFPINAAELAGIELSESLSSDAMSLYRL
jgi:hypothetical protein